MIRTVKKFFSENNFFFKTFFMIFFIMALLFSIYAYNTYQNSCTAFQKELNNTSIQETKNLSLYIDETIFTARYAISTLAINNYISFFFSLPQPENVLTDYSKRVQEQLMTVKYSNEIIEDIYLYSGASDTIITSSSHIKAESFQDMRWLDRNSSDQHGFSVFPYAMKNRYPYVICVAYHFETSHTQSAIAIFINLSRLSLLQNISQNKNQEFFIVSDQEKILYRHRQNSLYDPVSVSPYLTNYDASQEDSTTGKSFFLSDSNGDYTYSQLHSEHHPWTYVLVTQHQNYNSVLSSNTTILYALSIVFIMVATLIALLISLHSTKPIRAIHKLLDRPDLPTSINSSNDASIKYVASRITHYIETNQQLKQELSSRLDILNETKLLALQTQINPHFLFNTLNMAHVLITDSLGYDHKASDILLNLASLLRYSLDSTDTTPFEQDFSFIEAYLSILKIRYGDNFHIIKDISPSISDAKVPKLFLQPIIENAVFHGFSKKSDSICILSIDCTLQIEEHNTSIQKWVFVTIKDNGIGMNEDTLEQLKNTISNPSIPYAKNIGLRNVVQRMKLTYCDAVSFTINSTINEGTCFTIRFPYVD